MYSQHSKTIELPTDYVISKFYEYGYNVRYNTSGIYSSCCPICKEGKSWGKKQRCFYLVDKNIIYCHNCGWSSRPIKWIMRAGGISYDTIMKEISQNDYDCLNLDKIDQMSKTIADNIMETNSTYGGLPDDAINLSNKLQLEYYKDNAVVSAALEYIKSRRLDTAINRCDLFLSLNDPTHKNRLIIPFRDESNSVLFYQSRAFGAGVESDLENIKYLSMHGKQKSVWGLENVSTDKYVFILEGPIDAMFVRNGIAVGGINSSKSNFNELQQKQIEGLAFNHKFVWCVDSQWMDKTASDKTKQLLTNGNTVFMWPYDIGTKYKDFNEYCVSNNVNEFPKDVIIKNTLKGEYGLIKYNLLMNKNLRTL